MKNVPDWEISDAGGDVCCLCCVPFHRLQHVPQLFLRSQETLRARETQNYTLEHCSMFSNLFPYLFGFESVPHDVLEHNEKVLQGHVVRVEHSAMFQRRFDQLFDHQFRDIDQIASLDGCRVSSCNIHYQGQPLSPQKLLNLTNKKKYISAVGFKK
jgi:hypothetical protein